MSQRFAKPCRRIGSDLGNSSARTRPWEHSEGSVGRRESDRSGGAAALTAASQREAPRGSHQARLRPAPQSAFTAGSPGERFMRVAMLLSVTAQVVPVTPSSASDESERSIRDFGKRPRDRFRGQSG